MIKVMIKETDSNKESLGAYPFLYISGQYILTRCQIVQLPVLSNMPLVSSISSYNVLNTATTNFECGEDPYGQFSD